MLTSLAYLQQRNFKKSKKSMKLVNIEAENLHILWKICEISMKFSGMVWFIIILKVTKKTEFDPFSRKHIFGKTTGVGVKLIPQPF